MFLVRMLSKMKFSESLSNVIFLIIVFLLKK